MMGPRTRAASARRDRGFTLIEVLAALVVFGFLVAGLAAAVRFGLTSWRVGVETAARDADLDQTARTVTRLINAMQAAPANGAPTVLGTAGEFAFVTRLPMVIGDPPTHFADASIGVSHRDGQAGRLILRLIPHYHAVRIGPAPAPSETVLATGVQSVAWSYFSRADNRWTSSWHAPQAPQLCRLTVTLTDRRRRWPPIVAGPLTVPPTQ